MKRLILFRYHNNFDICKVNVDCLRELNPKAILVGMYGGDIEKLPPKQLLNKFDYNYTLPFEDPLYKWMHGDLCIRNWFKNQGRKIKFDVLNLTEWDMLLLKPLDELYKDIKKEDFGITEKFSFSEALKINWHWIAVQKWQWEEQIKELEKHTKKKVKEKDLYFGIFGGMQIPRSFLKKYIKLTPSSYTNDEARICLYAQTLGYKIEDNGLHNKKNLFEADGYEDLNDKLFLDKIKKGATALHPIRSLKLMKKLINYKEINE